MSGGCDGSGERDWRDGPDNGSRTMDELSSEEISRALASPDKLLKADAKDAYFFLAWAM